MTAKKLIALLLGLGWLTVQSVTAADQPKGRLIELHSCEVYAGACMVSSEVTLGGRYLLQAWDLTSGSWQGTSLAGLQAVVLESGSENLAEAGTQPDRSVVYLPETANEVQRNALLAWLKSQNVKLAASRIETRVVPVRITTKDNAVTAVAGEFARVRAVSLGDCENRVCGESLWYEPSTPTSLFTVARDAGSDVNEPLLELKWSDHGKRSAFVARFGEAGSVKNAYVQSDDWCSAAGRLF
jgi:hypothetical protein